MKLKINEAGWLGYTGEFGGIEFVDGVSVSEVTAVQAQRVANLIRIETEDGFNPSASQMVLDCRGIPMSEDMNVGRDAAISGAMAPKVWTQEELDKLASDKGIAAIREIADPMELKSNSVAKLISMILDAQKPKTQKSAEGLLGSGVQPAAFEINGKSFVLGDIVRAAFEKSGKTADEWNAQADEVRELAIEAEVQNFKATM